MSPGILRVISSPSRKIPTSFNAGQESEKKFYLPTAGVSPDGERFSENPRAGVGAFGFLGPLRGRRRLPLFRFNRGWRCFSFFGVEKKILSTSILFPRGETSPPLFTFMKKPVTFIHRLSPFLGRQNGKKKKMDSFSRFCSREQPIRGKNQQGPEKPSQPANFGKKGLEHMESVLPVFAGNSLRGGYTG